MAQELIQMRGIVKRFYVGEPNELEILHGIDLMYTRENSSPSWAPPAAANQR